MKYSKLSHEERELVLYIKNNEKAYTVVRNATTTKKFMVKQCAINYCDDNCTNKDNWNDVFTQKNINNVTSYFNAN